MEGTLTMACYRGNPNYWVLGQLVTKAGNKVLKSPFLFVSGNNQVGLSELPGAGKENVILLGDPMFFYPLDSQTIEDLYIEATTGIKVERAPLARNVVMSPGETLIPSNVFQLPKK